MIVSRKTSLRTVLAVAGALLVSSFGVQGATAFEVVNEKTNNKATEQTEQGNAAARQTNKDMTKPGETRKPGARRLLGVKEGRAKANLRNKKRRKPTPRKRTARKARPANANANANADTKANATVKEPAPKSK